MPTTRLTRSGQHQRSTFCPVLAMLPILTLLPVPLLHVPAVMAQDCQVPLFVEQQTADINCMILLDNSGSMNEVTFHPDYDKDVVYTGPFQSDSMYFIAHSGYRTPRDFNLTWPNTPSAYLVNSENGEDGRYSGNYLNWIFYHADDLQRAAIPRVTRIQVAKLVLCEIVERVERIKFGIAVYQNADGANIIGKCGKNVNALQSIIMGVTANAWTPTGEAMEDILDYFADTGPDAPIEVPCQYNFLIVMTDGYPTRDLNVSSYLWDADGDGNDPGNCASIGAPLDESNECSDYMDDVAYYMRHHDVRPDMAGPGAAGEDFQFVYTYTIGYGLQSPLLQETADNGEGKYYVAENALELLRAFKSAVMEILVRVAAGSGVAIVSSESDDEDRLYRGIFLSGYWYGLLESYALPYSEGDQPLWEAGDILSQRNPRDRYIFTALGSTPYPFNAGQATTLQGPMQIPDLSTATDVINWTLGQEVAGRRNRHGWPLGDIVHSSPIVVGHPRGFFVDSSYMQFLEQYADRERTIYIGANDGMLHAFRASDGEELWAFIPELALPRLAAISDTSYCHLYTCDDTPTVQDVKIGGQWRTTLVAGSREGPPGVFALDITDPYAPSIMWQASIPDGKSFVSHVELCKVGDTPLAMVGSGLDEDTGRAYIHCYDLVTGQLLGSRLLSSFNNHRNKASMPEAVDMELDGKTDLVYCCDLLGNVWRLAVGDSPDPTSWDLTCLYAGSQPITSPPAAAFGEMNKVGVYFGTGAYLEAADVTDTRQQSFYCVFDTHDGSTHTRSDLVDQTSGHNMGAGDGWYVDLWHDDGERVTEPAVVAASTVLFTSYMPNPDPCGTGGSSWLYRLSYDNGTQPHDREGQEMTRDVALGEGFASHPVLDLVNETVTVQSSDARILVQDFGVSFFRMTVKAWQESYDNVVLPAEPAPAP